MAAGFMQNEQFGELVHATTMSPTLAHVPIGSSNGGMIAPAGCVPFGKQPLDVALA